LPPTSEELEFRRLLNDLELDLRVKGITLDQFLEMSGLSSLSELKESWKERIRENVIVGAFLDKYAEENGLTVYPEEIEARIDELAETLSIEPKKLKDAMLRDGSFYTVKLTLLREKVLDELIKKCKFHIVDSAGGEEKNPAEKG
jgi:FKBP-type peptidyl-prolyl cis-trans isomerase (trigger factor)